MASSVVPAAPLRAMPRAIDALKGDMKTFLSEPSSAATSLKRLKPNLLKALTRLASPTVSGRG